MATVNSDILTDALNLDVQVDQGHYKAVKGVSATVATGGALADNSTIHFVEVPVDALIDSVILASDDLGTTGDINIGFYKGLAEVKRLGGTVAALVSTDAVDEDAIGSAIDVNAAAVVPTEIRFETKGIETINQRAWELAGLSARPGYDTFLVSGTLSEATTAGGDVTLRVHFRI